MGVFLSVMVCGGLPSWRRTDEVHDLKQQSACRECRAAALTASLQTTAFRGKCHCYWRNGNIIAKSTSKEIRRKPLSKGRYGKKLLAPPRSSGYD
jgi:hypothetical protein